MYCRFVDDISIKMWVPKNKVDYMIIKIKMDLNSWHACIKIDPIRLWTHLERAPQVLVIFWMYLNHTNSTF